MNLLIQFSELSDPKIQTHLKTHEISDIKHYKIFRPTRLKSHQKFMQPRSCLPIIKCQIHHHLQVT